MTSPYNAAQRAGLGAGQAMRGTLSSWWNKGKVDITAGAGMPLEPQSRYEARMRQQAVKEQADRARAAGVGGPNKAAAIARQAQRQGEMHRVLGAIGHALGAGEAVPPASRGGLKSGFTPKLAYDGRPGDMGHISAIMAAAEQVRPVNDTAANAIRNAGRAVAERNMDEARTHLGVALQATRGTGSASIVKSIQASLADVPKGTYERLPYGSGMAPRSIGTHQPGIRGGPGYYPSPAAVVGASWEAVLGAVELSAQTGRLAVTPAPLGRPGGPGLYDVKGMGHSPYFQNVVKALIEKRGMPKGRAYAIAWSALRKWRRGGGHVHPEVRAAATGALADEAAKGAAAKLAHGHA